MSKVKAKYIDFGTATNQVSAANIPLSTTNLNKNLSSSDTDLQHAIETIDNLDIGGGLTWNAISSATTAAVNNAYVTTNGSSRVIITLPSASNFNTIKVVGNGAAGWRISAPSGVIIYMGNQSSVSGGYLESLHQRDCVEMIYYNSSWTVVSGIGNITIA